jgi:glycogen debranching enzyme
MNILVKTSLDEFIRVRDQYYILATSSLADTRTHVLKHNDTFAVFDRLGDIAPLGQGHHGIYYEGTRFLSKSILKIEGQRPMLLSSSVENNNILLLVNLTNPDIYIDGNIVIPRGVLHISRSKFLWENVCHEQVRVTNYGPAPVKPVLSIEFDADFADVFEVRGMKRQHRGRRESEVAGGECAVLHYQGLDRVTRTSLLQCSPKPERISPRQIDLDLQLESKGKEDVFLTLSCTAGSDSASRHSFEVSYSDAIKRLKKAEGESCEIYTDNEQFNDWLNRSASDLRMLVSETPAGPYPYAGVPWFSTEFGRDGIITAFETLWFDPGIARGVLAYLAATQAQEVDPEADAEPGKILHETRKGEMAALKEVPFERYYGSVDATPLFITLAASYYHRTGDRKFIEQIWPNIRLALEWITNYGDSDGDGFVEYASQSPAGLKQQGWKDSGDSVFHSDGALAEPPIALSEVQGYVYAAKYGAARLAEVMRDAEAAAALRREAQLLRENFDDAFWCEEISTYALALDGRKKPCRVRASNAGHTLFTRIASPAHGARLAETLFASDLFSGWGIRTLSTQETRYNPMSYHNGSVWPHDNALIASGLARYGFSEAAGRLLVALFDAAIFFNRRRLPELFCGFPKQSGEAPVEYPVACLPQAWSAAAVFMLLGACLGLSVKGSPPEIRFTHAFLPPSISHVQIKNLRAGGSSADLVLNRLREDVAVQVLRKEGRVAIISSK